MKTKITALALITATALSLAPKPAVASDKGLALVGGFLGGLIVASAINDSRHDDYYPARNTTVVVNERCNDRGPDGYWKEVSVRFWVPGCWVVDRGYRGCDSRRYVEGHYSCRNDRVWVSNDRRDHRDRDVSYGYGHRR